MRDLFKLRVAIVIAVFLMTYFALVNFLRGKEVMHPVRLSKTKKHELALLPDISNVIEPDHDHALGRDHLSVYLTDGIHTAMEIDFWVSELLGHINRPLRIRMAGEPIESNSLVMGASFGGVAEQITSRGLKNVGIFHWADEGGTSDVIDRVYPKVAYVLRQYYYKELMDRFKGKIVWIPNGFRTGVGPVMDTAIVPATERRLLCKFVGSAYKGAPGQRTNARNEMVNALEELGNPCYLEYVEGFGGGKSPMEYSGILRDSKFTLCPWGNSKETIRFYDALETGSIPVHLSGAPFFEALSETIGDKTPFVEISSWSVLKWHLEFYTKNPEKLLDKQLECRAWWREFKAKKSLEIAQIMNITRVELTVPPSVK